MRHLKLITGLAAGAIALGAVAFLARPAVAQAFTAVVPSAQATPDPNATPGPGGQFGPHGDFRGGGGPGAFIDATVSVTGLTRDEVLTDLKNGQSLAQIAQSKGKTADDVIAAARVALQDRLKQDVTDGHLTQANADAKLQQFDQTASNIVNSTTLGQGGGPGFGPGFDHGGPGGFGRDGGPQGGPHSLVEATVSVTGLTRDEVMTDLKNGQSLAQIAQSKGKTADDVIAAARTALQDALKQAVTNNRLTQAQADSELAAFDQNASQWVNSTSLDAGFGGQPGFGHGGPGRFGPEGGAGSLIGATASVTGLTPQEIFADLQKGQSLAQIAQSKGKTADDVIAAARTQLQDMLKQAVSAGRLTQAEADAKLQQFDQQATQTMNDTTLGQNLGRPHFNQPDQQATPTGGSSA